MISLSRSWIITTTILVLLPCLLGGCVKQEAAVAPPKPITVEFSFAPLGNADSEVAYVMPMFKVSNPNEYLVSVDLSYTLHLEDEVIAGSQVPTFYVPEQGEVTVRDVVGVVYMGWLSKCALSKIDIAGSMPAAIQYVTPFWKQIGGKRPAAVPEELWDTIEPADAVAVSKVSVVVSATGGEAAREYLELELESQW